MSQLETRPTTATLYERIGGGEKLRAIIGALVDAHLENSAIRTRFEPFDRTAMKDSAFQFFAQAMGGAEVYTGRGLVETHRGMNVSEHEFMAATDDVLAVLQRFDVPQQEQLEVLGALFAMKGEVLHQ